MDCKNVPKSGIASTQSDAIRRPKSVNIAKFPATERSGANKKFGGGAFPLLLVALPFENMPWT